MSNERRPSIARQRLRIVRAVPERVYARRGGCVRARLASSPCLEPGPCLRRKFRRRSLHPGPPWYGARGGVRVGEGAGPLARAAAMRPRGALLQKMRKDGCARAARPRAGLGLLRQAFFDGKSIGSVT